MNKLFDKAFDVVDRKGEQFRISSDQEMFKFLRQFIVLEELPRTNYKHKLGYYKKKGHYINGRKVNRQIYNYIKRWLKKQDF